MYNVILTIEWFIPLSISAHSAFLFLLARNWRSIISFNTLNASATSYWGKQRLSSGLSKEATLQKIYLSLKTTMINAVCVTAQKWVPVTAYSAHNAWKSRDRSCK